MKWPNEENRYWLDFLIAEKNRIESMIRAIEARGWSWLITMTCILVGSSSTSSNIYLLAFIPMILLMGEGKAKKKFEDIREGYSHLIWDMMINEEEIEAKYIQDRVSDLRKKEMRIERYGKQLFSPIFQFLKKIKRIVKRYVCKIEET